MLKVRNIMRIMLALITAVFASTAIAGPDATTERLLYDGPSMLDWGIMRLETHLITNQNINHNPSVEYNWDENTITISGYIFSGEVRNEKEARQDCKRWFGAVRVDANVDTDGSLFVGTVSEYAQYFLHSGYDRRIDEMKILDVLSDLDKKFKLSFWSVVTNDDGFKNKMTCTGPLVGTPIAYEISQ